MDKYRIFTEAVDTRPGSAKDTSFRAPLTQLLSMKGPITVPPATIKIPVIYYDYRADSPNQPTGGSNPEFEMWSPGGWEDGVHLNSVLSPLTYYTSTDAAYFGRASIPKPRRNSTGAGTRTRTCGINMWFQDWVPVSWVYNYSTPWDCATHWDARTDRWKNYKIKDYLTFVLDETQGPSTYVYNPVGGFFPIDGKGFGSQPVTWNYNPNNHNFAFCTEVHTTFIHQSGLKFEFSGDDDVWAFIDKRLVLDLGGLHPSTSKYLYLDDLGSLGLTFGATYDFDFFQCERHTNESNCRIATNIKMTPPTGVPVAGWKRDYGSLD